MPLFNMSIPESLKKRVIHRVQTDLERKQLDEYAKTHGVIDAGTISVQEMSLYPQIVKTICKVIHRVQTDLERKQLDEYAKTHGVIDAGTISVQEMSLYSQSLLIDKSTKQAKTKHQS